ncbi:hypothetical protein KBD59_03570 [Candidatus Gracilibacteria bacterium]|nr:hypothetical protein [Candidatus Gracilibacteria bacterium]
MTWQEEYQQIITGQREYLLGLQKTFHEKCEEAKKTAQDKIAALPDDDTQGREEILKQEKSILDGALKELKETIALSTRATMKKLEVVVRKQEEETITHLEEELALL